jgi:hypothetical protein
MGTNVDSYQVVLYRKEDDEVEEVIESGMEQKDADNLQITGDFK